MNSSERAIYEFQQAYSFRTGLEYSTNICVNRGDDCIYCDDTEWQISEDVRYQQYTVNILWSIGENSWRALNLHGSYNTNFQTFRYANGKIEITDKGNNIVITISGQ